MVAIGADDKKKIYILLGLAGVLGVLVLVFLKPFGGGSGASRSAVTKTTVATGPAAPGAPTTPGGLPGAPTVAAASTAPAGGSSGGAPAVAGLQLINAPRFRADPFVPFFTPTLPPAKPLPGPLDIPRPVDSSAVPLLVPGELAAPGGAPATLQQLPPVSLPGYRMAGALSLPPPTVLEGAQPAPVRSPNKRLAGVIMGDSITALLEISTGTDTVERVVQPGDEVDGIKVLRIERVTENGEQTMRMTVSENGQETFFDLQPAPQATGRAAPTGGMGPAIRPLGRTPGP